MANHNTLTSLFSDIAGSIRSVEGSSEQIVADNFPEKIQSLGGGAAATPATTITKSPEISVTTRGVINSSYVQTTSVTPTITAGYVSAGTAGTITATGSSTYQLTTRNSNDLTIENQVFNAPAGYYAAAATKSVSGAGSATTPNTTIVKNPTISLTTNGLITSQYQESEMITPVVVSGYIINGTAGEVSTVGSANFQLTTKNSSNLTANNAVVSAPAGYYASPATKSVTLGSVETPATTITKNPTISVSTSGLITSTYEGSKSVTPSLNSGWISSANAGTILTNGSSSQQLTTRGSEGLSLNGTVMTAQAGYYTSTTNVNIGGGVIYPCYDGTGTAAITTSPYNYAKWDGLISNITNLYDGLTIAYKVPIAGHATYGTCLQINNLGYHPVVRLANTAIGTRYGVGYTTLLIYSSIISGTVYENSGSSSTIAGCWICINDVDDNNYAQTSSIRLPDASLYKTSTACGRYMLLLTQNEEYLLPTTAVNNSTSTSKALTTEEFDPFGPIFYYAYSGTTQQPADYVFPANILYSQTHMDLQRALNTGTTLTTGLAVYLVATIQSNGKAKLTSPVCTQTLPTTEDGKVYIYLGQALSNAAIVLAPIHNVYEYKNGKICIVTNQQGGGQISGSLSSHKFTIALSPQGGSTNLAFAAGSNITLTDTAGSNQITIASTDTKNTTGSTNTTSKIYLTGATSQAANAQTYSNNKVSVTNGTLDATIYRVNEKVSLAYNSTTQALDFIFV